jgi:hypothetical protein
LYEEREGVPIVDPVRKNVIETQPFRLLEDNRLHKIVETASSQLTERLGVIHIRVRNL